MDASIFVYHGQSMGENIDAVLLISALIRKKEVNVNVYRAFFYEVDTWEFILSIRSCYLGVKN